jgi:negative regulator of flagellin synthesis FlgM
VNIDPQGPVARSRAAAGPETARDQVDLSDAARLSRRLENLPPDRAELIARIRTEIAEGTYETPEKIALAVDAIRNSLDES